MTVMLGGFGLCGIPENLIAALIRKGVKETRVFDGKHYLMERSLRADVSLIKAWRADRHGNLIYRKTARNFNPAMATAAELTIVEVEELVELGELNPDEIATPGIYVDRVVVGAAFQKPIEGRFIKEHVQR